MTINIPLFDGYRILSDPHNFILAREEGPRLRHLTFHNSIQDAVQSFLDFKIKDFDSTSLHSFIMSLNSLQARLSKALQTLNLNVEDIKLNHLTEQHVPSNK